MTDQIWSQLREKLPWKKTEQHRMLREKQWFLIDINQNGIVSLAEFDKAMRDILQVPQLFAAKPVLLRAFNAAKAKSKSDSSYGDDYIEKSEYRHLLKYLRIYYEYFVAFQRIDVNGDRRISYKEFERAAPYLQRWGIDTSNLQREWSECDQDGGGQVLFDEFAYWAIKKNLDIEDDDDDDDNTDSDPDYAVDRDISERELKLYAQKQKQKPPLKLKNHDSKIWEELRRKLPWKKTATDKRLRDEQWRILDNNKNGLLSLAEFDKGLRDVLELPVLFKTKPVIIRAFTSAKSKVKSNADAGDDYIQKKEYRYLLKYLRQYYEYWVAFDRLDQDGDKKISKAEFIQATPFLKKWGIDMSDPAAQWKKCDQDGGGQVLFDEFASWAIKCNLDLDDDDDVTDSDIDPQRIDRAGQNKKYLDDYKKKEAVKAKPGKKSYDNRIWVELKKKLPFEDNAEDARLRDQQWRIIDNNKNGYISLAEFDKGLKDVIQLPILFHTKPVILRAFTSAKSKVKSSNSHGDDYVEKSEYRFLLKYLRQYYEYWVAFDLIDLDGDRKITFEEFQNAAPMMKKWGLDMSNPKEAWKEVDTDNFGKVLFDEFSVWAIKKSLDLDDDDDVPDSDIEVVEIDRQAQANKYLAEHKQKQAQKAKPKRKTYDTKIWAELKRKLPFENSPKDAKLRDEQWRVLDNNKNGIISLAEFEKGLVDTLNLPQLFKIKPVTLRAFTAAKNKVKGSKSHDKDFVSKNEYRYLLKYLRQYYEYWVAFDLIDLDGDRRITYQEFEYAIPQLKQWGIDMSNPKAQWAKCDADKAGKVLFDEFANWAIKLSLDLDDDDDVPDSDIEVVEIDRKAQNKQYLRDYKEKQAANAYPKLKNYDTSIWKKLQDKLPWEKNAQHEKLREQQWRKIDNNRNGHISLAEFEKGLIDVIDLPQLFKTKPVLIRAFNAAKNKVKGDNSSSKDFVQRSEYRFLLKYLRMYYEYWVAFDLIDTDGDRRITQQEFERAKPQLQNWGIDMSNPAAQWKKCDADGGGMVLFDEFANWAIKQSLDLDDDDDVPDSDIEIQEIDRQAQIQQYLAEHKKQQRSRAKPKRKSYDNRIWQQLKEKLPWKWNGTDERRRNDLWRQLDNNKNGLLSLAEFDKGLQAGGALDLPILFKTKPVVIRAFNAAKGKIKSKNDYGDDFIEKKEFRYLLKYLRQYYEYWVAFDLIDLDGDKRLSYQEFQYATSQLQSWGIDMSNPKAQWKQCDADNKGKVLFDEFASWAIKKNLDLDDDDDVTDSDIEDKGIDRVAQNKKYLADYKKAQAAKAVPRRKKYDSSIWAELKHKLPWEKNATHEKQREEYWRQMDTNRNGMLSLAEFDKGVQDVINLPQLFETKPVLIRAFNAAKAKVKSKSSKGDDYIEKTEFRYLFKYLRQYYEYWVAFDLIDTDGDKRITFKEFKQAAPQIAQWNINMSNPEAQWKKCDADNGGMVLFDEFANWAIKQSLDLDDDDDVTDSDIEVQNIDRAGQNKKYLQEYKEKQKAKNAHKPKKYDNSIWATLKDRLPWEKTPAHEQLRDQQWKALDNNNNGLLSLAEFEKGLQAGGALNLPSLFKTKPVLIRAFNAAKNKVKSKSAYGDDYIEKSEYRFLLKYLRQYFEYWVAFDLIDLDGDKRITFKEFKLAAPQLKSWGIDMSNPEAQWKKCDTDRGGMVLFDEFANWAIKQSLDLDDDDDVTDSDIEVQDVNRGQQTKKYLKQYKQDQAKKAEGPKKTYDRSIWATLKERIPWEKNAQAEAKRAEYWRALDFNGNGHLSLAEVDKGMVSVFKLPQLFKTKPVIIRAFNAAKGKVKGKSRHSDDYIQKTEFRDFCKYIRQYYEYWVAFDLIDKDGDKRISFAEFKQASPQLTNWKIDMSNPEEQWKKCDADGGGMVLFDEFANWAIKQSLDLDDDDDVTDSDIEVQNIDREDATRKRLRKYRLDKLAKEKELKHATRKRYDNKIWDRLREALPWEKTEEGRQARIKLWRQIDQNGNGLLSLAEIQKGMRDVLLLPQLFDAKPVMLRAFNAAKNKVKSNSRHGKDYVEKKEFRYLLKYLRQYYEYWIAFDLIDYDSDKRISFGEFKDAIPNLEKWGIDMSDPLAQWRECDADGKGMVLFDEFSAWAIRKNLDLDDDDDVPDSDIDGKQVKRAPGGQRQVAKYGTEQKKKKQKEKSKAKTQRNKSQDAQVKPKPYDNRIWAELKQKLPWEKTAQDRSQRISLWMQMDVNNNGLLSLAELDKGMKDIIRLPLLFKTKPVMLRAFNAAKAKVKSKSKYGDDYVERAEFRFLLKYLRQYFEYWIAFDQIDTDGDKRVSYREFKYAQPQLKRWGVDTSDMHMQWKECDADGAGQVLFDEFANWAIKQSLDLDDDDDVSEGELEAQNLERNMSQKYLEQYKKDQKAKEIKKLKEMKPKYDNTIWAQLSEKLPYQMTEVDRYARKRQWRAIDINGNGLVSLAELDKGMRDVIRIPLLFKTKPVMIRAFNAAKDKVKSKSKHGEDYVERGEYRYLLKYLRQYYEYWVAFDQIDLDGDKRITYKEFEFAIPILKRWGIEMSDPKARFKECDSDGKGMVLFDEFCHWAIKQNLKLPDEETEVKSTSSPTRQDSPERQDSPQLNKFGRIHASMKGLQGIAGTERAGTGASNARGLDSRLRKVYDTNSNAGLSSLPGKEFSRAPSIDQQIKIAAIRDLQAVASLKLGSTGRKYDAAKYSSNMISSHVPKIDKTYSPNYQKNQPGLQLQQQRAANKQDHTSRILPSLNGNLSRFGGNNNLSVPRMHAPMPSMITPSNAQLNRLAGMDNNYKSKILERANYIQNSQPRIQPIAPTMRRIL